MRRGITSIAAAALMAAAVPLLDRGNAKVNSNPAAINIDLDKIKAGQAKVLADFGLMSPEERQRREIAAWNAAVDAKKAARHRATGKRS